MAPVISENRNVDLVFLISSADITNGGLRLEFWEKWLGQLNQLQYLTDTLWGWC